MQSHPITSCRVWNPISEVNKRAKFEKTSAMKACEVDSRRDEALFQRLGAKLEKTSATLACEVDWIRDEALIQGL